MKKLLGNLALTLGSVYLTLLVINIFIFDIYSGAVFDMRSRYDIVAELNQQGVEAYPMAPPSSLIETSSKGFGPDELIPLAGVSGVNTIYCNENGYTTSYTADRYGFNNPDEVWDSREQDMVLIGDSYTQGACVNTDEDIAGTLRAKGRKVANLGVGGHGPLLELATMTEFATEFKPKAVVWLYCEANDLYFMTLERKFGYLNQYLQPGFSKGLKSQQSVIDDGWKTRIAKAQAKRKASLNPSHASVIDYLTFHNFSALYDKLDGGKRAQAKRDETWREMMKKSDKVEELMTHLYYDAKANIEPFGEVLTRAKQLANQQGAEFYFVYLPTYERYDYGLGSYEQEVLAVVKDLDIQVIDFGDYMDEHPDPLSLFPFRKRGHFTPETYKVLADMIDERVN